jgi:hypothetical protein
MVIFPFTLFNFGSNLNTMFLVFLMELVTSRTYEAFNPAKALSVEDS